MAYVLSNKSIVEWAACVVWGPDSSVTACLEDFLNGDDTIHFRKGETGEYEKCSDTVKFGSTVYTVSAYTDVYVDDDGNPAPDHSFIRFCPCFFASVSPYYLATASGSTDTICIIVASILAHELAHACGWNCDSEADPCDFDNACSKVERFEQLVRDALMRKCGNDSTFDDEIVFAECDP